MPVLRKRAYFPQDRIAHNGLYVHSNPPRGKYTFTLSTQFFRPLNEFIYFS